MSRSHIARLIFQFVLVAAQLSTAQKLSAQETTNPRLVLICAPCHGSDGIGRDGKTPNLAGQKREYLEAQMRDFRSGKRRHPSMNFYSGEVNAEELNQLLNYYAALPQR